MDVFSTWCDHQSGVKDGLFSRLFTAASLAVGLTLSVMAYQPANAVPSNSPTILTSAKTSALIPAAVSSPLADGVYLYGEEAQPDVLGRSYFVFEVKQGQVLGALYMPSSSFDCAAGQFQANQLALTVRGAYDPTPIPFEIALDRSGVVASNDVQTEIGLEGFQRLEKVSDNDHRILEMCKATLSKTR